MSPSDGPVSPMNATSPSGRAPSAVVFDLGKVLLEFDFGIAARALAAASRLPEGEIRPVLDQSPLLHEYESGRIGTRRFYEEVTGRIGYQGDEPAFQRAFADIFGEIAPMVALHADLRSRGIPAFIFSNTNEIAVQHIRARYPFFRDFDGHVLSYEVGSMKPHARIYEAVETMTGRRGEELLFIDDRLENVEAARSRGWQALHHQDPQRTPAEVRRRLGLP